MDNSGEWKPGGFAVKDGKLGISTDRAELAVQSRLITWLEWNRDDALGVVRLARRS